METTKLNLDQLFQKIENCNKWIGIHKKNRNNPDFDIEDCNSEIIRITEIKNSLQKQFDDLYKNS